MTAPRAGRGASRDADRPSCVLITLTDVEPAVRINALLEGDGLTTQLVSPIDDIRAAIRRQRPDVVVLTGALLDPHQTALVRHLLWDGIPVVGLTDVSDPQTTERLRQAGYAELYPKPVLPEEVADGVRRLLDRQRLQRVTGLIGESEAVHEVLVKVEQIAPVSSTVLIEGESGTGKELVARAIHRLSPRRAKPFIAVNVGALPETLLESELFGHEKGAFTGAAERRLGRFELADSGTLFLDEIGEIPPATQVKLLRVLEEREVTRLGAAQPIEVDVRVVAATNRPLREHVADGTFRADLFYRLDVLRIYLPPLRERRSDIPLLVRRFVAEFATRHDRPFHGLTADAMALLVEYPWPGNVRELRNLIESMVVLAPGREIRPEDLPRHLREGRDTLGARLLPVAVGPVVRDGERAQGRELEFIVRSLLELKLQMEELRRRLDEERSLRLAAEALATPAVPPVTNAAIGPGAIEAREVAPPPNTVTITPGMTMAEIERAAIESALRETAGNRRRAADLLGIGERTLYRKLHEYQLLDVAPRE
ncbi:MAG: sigma-54-dependent Fis family transcriptional regulator [Gemmatirosa sp.]|nr:sigma-54-dependent Fis family transcriptional regulator [Gemmatirosa sp.]